MLTPRRREILIQAAIVLSICGYFLWFAGEGLVAYFSPDDLRNLYGYETASWGGLLAANVLFFGPAYRPLGGVYYKGLFAAFGLEPLPYRITCFAILAINLFLLYLVLKALTNSREMGAIGALLASFHARLIDLYFNTAVIYDLLCFLFYFAALLYYIRLRNRAAPPLGRIALLLALYAMALNAKEMALSLPLAIAVLELVYREGDTIQPQQHPWWRQRAAAILAPMVLMSALYVWGKMSAGSIFAGHFAYTPVFSVERYLETSRHYLDLVFYRVGEFTSAAALITWAGLFLVAWVLKDRSLKFSALFIVFSLAPVSFISPRGGFVLYIPMAGFVCYAARLMVGARQWILRKWAERFPGWPEIHAPGHSRLNFTSQAVLFVSVAAVLFPMHAFERGFAVAAVSEPARMTREIIEFMRSNHPVMQPDARILVLDDPFARNFAGWDWTPVFAIRLLYRDPKLTVDQAWRLEKPLTIREWRSYDCILTYVDGTLREVPANHIVPSGKSLPAAVAPSGQSTGRHPALPPQSAAGSTAP